MIRVAATVVPYDSPETCGDFFIHDRNSDNDLIVLGDVGGHGSSALPVIARECREVILRHRKADLRRIVSRVDGLESLKRTGLVLCVARFHHRLSLFEYAAVGNLKLYLVRDGAIRRQPIQEGIVGYTLPKTLRVNVIKMVRGDSILAVSDGVTVGERWLGALPWTDASLDELLSEIAGSDHANEDDRSALLVQAFTDVIGASVARTAPARDEARHKGRKKKIAPRSRRSSGGAQ